MSTPASHAAAPRHSDSAGRDWPVICLPESAEACGPVTPIAQTARRDALRRLQSEREALADRLARLQRQGRSREASLTARDLRAVTTRLMELGRE